MVCCKCGKEIETISAKHCASCGKDYCDRCASTLCDCAGELGYYS